MGWKYGFYHPILIPINVPMFLFNAEEMKRRKSTVLMKQEIFNLLLDGILLDSITCAADKCVKSKLLYWQKKFHKRMNFNLSHILLLD